MTFRTRALVVVVVGGAAWLGACSPAEPAAPSVIHTAPHAGTPGSGASAGNPNPASPPDALAALPDDVLPALDAASDARASAIVEELRAVSDPGLGYSGAYTGSEFLPYPGSGTPEMLLLQQPAPVASGALARLVALGAPAVPALVRCLADARATRLPPMRAMMWMSFANELDENRRTDRAALPHPGAEDPQAPSDYQVKVGDLCFVALGQIVNRRYAAVRYQPSGGLVVSSPPGAPALARALTEGLRGFSSARHREALMRDVQSPDYAGRREGALLRLSYYYPHALEELVVDLLARPTYDVLAVWAFAHEVLYPEKDAARRSLLFERFVAERGKPARAGLELVLFDDLATLEADEQGRLSPPLTRFGQEPRALLISLYGRAPEVRASDKPFASSLTENELARLVVLLVHDESARIDAAVDALAARTQHPDVKSACAQRSAVRRRGHAPAPAASTARP